MSGEDYTRHTSDGRERINAGLDFLNLGCRDRGMYRVVLIDKRRKSRACSDPSPNQLLSPGKLDTSVRTSSTGRLEVQGIRTSLSSSELRERSSLEDILYSGARTSDSDSLPRCYMGRREAVYQSHILEPDGLLTILEEYIRLKRMRALQMI